MKNLEEKTKWEENKRKKMKKFKLDLNNQVRNLRIIIRK